MVVEQTVQVKILGAARAYTYAWHFDPVKGETPLRVGDKVEIPPNQVQEEGSSATVSALGSDYYGPMKKIVRRIKTADEARSERVRGVLNSWPGSDYHGEDDDGGPLPKPDNGLWDGFGQGDYA